jgi:Tfp pilus assembly protein PilF
LVAAGRHLGGVALAVGLAGGMFAWVVPEHGHAAERPEGCVQVARIVSMQGTLQIRRSGQQAWATVRKLDTALCQDDLLHAGPRSRAALLIGPETLVRLDQRTTLAVRQSPDETIVEFARDPGLFQTVGTTPNPCGAGYFITRFPRKFRVIAPFIDATVEGTEFLVALRCESSILAVFEGKVLAQEVQNASSRAFSLKQGDSLEAGGPQPAAVKLLVKPVDAVQWALYYPPITDPVGEATADQRCDQADTSARAVCILQRAEQRLRAGRVEEAEADIQSLLSTGIGGGDAYALLSIVAVVKNDKAGALELAERATQASPASARAWLALSYAQQASFELDKALEAARKAAGLAPKSSLAQARVAELLMSTGEIREAEKAAQAAVKANVNDARAHMVLGFVRLAQIDTAKARQDFLTAIELDSTEPLARLGLGLAIIRDGELVEGREQLEIAVILDPTNSLLRSYVGKAYYEERTEARDRLARIQFDAAERLDPNDPTPWFYEAILKQTQNRPGEAFDDLQQSIALNDNRAVYRSRLLLDQDLASRNVGLGYIYRDLGFGELAALEGWNSLAIDPANSSAHRLLADSYLSAPRLNAARQSELLQAQLRQPLSLTPLQPQLTEDRLAILRGTGPAVPGFNELNALFVRDEWSVLASAVVGSNATAGEQIVVSTLKNRWLFSLAQLAYETDGVREDNGLEKGLFDAFAQVQITPSTALQFEARSSRTTLEDPVLRFDPELFFSGFDEVNSVMYRAGLRHDISPRSDLLVSLMYVDSHEEQGQSGITFVDQNFDTYIAELQNSTKLPAVDVVSGLGYYTERRQLDFLGMVSETRPAAYDAYIYTYWRPIGPQLNIQAGLSYDYSDPDDGIGETLSEVNPKLGFIWSLPTGTSLRAAAFKSMKRRFFAGQSIEPTQVAGFSQYFDDLDRTVSKRWGVGLDQRLPGRLFAGAEYSTRESEVRQEGTNETFDWDEKQVAAYLNWLPTSMLALSAGYWYQKLNRPPNFPGIELFVEVETQRIPLRAAYFHPSGLAVEVTGTRVHQEGQFFFLSSLSLEPGSDSFWIADLTVSYRLPNRYGLFQVGVQNLFDEEFNYQETDLNAVTFSPGRIVLARVLLSF